MNENEEDLFQSALNCEPTEFAKAYKAYKKAQMKWEELFLPFKENVIKLHENTPNLSKDIFIDGVKFTYISPSTRNTIDTKKLKEEEPELAKKFTKITNVKATIRIDG